MSLPHLHPKHLVHKQHLPERQPLLQGSRTQQLQEELLVVGALQAGGKQGLHMRSQARCLRDLSPRASALWV